MRKILLVFLMLLATFPALFVSCDGNPGIPCEINIVASEGGEVLFSDYFGTSKHVYTGTKVTVIAVPNEGYAFLGWYVGDNETAISNNTAYTFVPQGDLQLVAKFGKYVVKISAADGGKVSFKGYAGTSLKVLPDEELTIVAEVDNGYKFSGWFKNGIKVSNELTYTFIVSEDISFVAKFGKDVASIDLGLPSGIKWAEHNVGATRPEEYGAYYAWGETEEKDNYNWITYNWCNGSDDTMTKYCTSSSFGTVDNKAILDPENDVAHVKWGGDWRMPTCAELEELRNNCSWEWTTLNNIKGYKVTGSNGNSIFLPASGFRAGTNLYYRDFNGYYWSSSLTYSRSNYAYYLYFNNDAYDWSYNYRNDGRTVRPVTE